MGSIPKIEFVPGKYFERTIRIDPCHNGFPLRLGRPQKLNGVATDLFCTGVIGHLGHMFLN